MKNLIYFAFNKDYLKLFKYSYYSIRNYNPEIEILCIIPKGLEIPKNFKVLKYEQEDFEFQYPARYTIPKWEKFEEYDNYLYLDSDTVCVDNLNDFFKRIEEQPNKIHAAKENDSINKADFHYNFNGSIFEEDCPSFNSGTFGFNKKLKNKFLEFLEFIPINKEKAVFFDQPLYNVFFHGLFTGSYNNYVELFERYKPFNPKLVHLTGAIYNPDGKDKIYRRFYRKETRGELLNLLLQKSTIGLFNCGDYFINGPIAHAQKEKEIQVLKDDYDVPDNHYDLIYIDGANNTNHLIEIIRSIYPKVKKGGIISSVSGKKEEEKVIKEFINKSNLDFFPCFEDEVFFTIKL
jgi:hypothetical protein